MKKIICIMGETGSGKSTIYNHIISEFGEKYHIKRLIYNTTRKKRENEVDGVDYHFVSEEDFYNTSMKNIVESRMYETKDNGTSIYYTSIDNFEMNDKDHILVCAGSPDQFIKYMDFMKYIKENTKSIGFYTIRIKANLKERLLHLIKRCNSDDQVYEAIRRIHDEQIDFDTFENTIIKKSRISTYFENEYNSNFNELEDFIKAVSED